MCDSDSGEAMYGRVKGWNLSGSAAQSTTIAICHTILRILVDK
jgi:hypothetical protein